MRLLICLGLLALCRCGGGNGGDGAADIAPKRVDVGVAEAAQDAGDVAAPLRAIVTDCRTCHVLAVLARVVDTQGLAPGAWMDARGAGLLRDDPAIPAPGTRFALAWPERGYHRQGEASACVDCHPVDERGLGHGVRAYARAADVFAGGASCATSCHGWIPAFALAHGPERAEGSHARWSGSLAPADLLAQG